MGFTHNHVTLAGNLTRDPEVRATNRSQVCHFTLASNRRYRAGEEMREETTFIDCEAWGKTAELVQRYLRKGNPAFIEGRLRQDQWEDKEGRRQSRIKIVAENVQFIGVAPGQAGASRSMGERSFNGAMSGAGGEAGEMVTTGAREPMPTYDPSIIDPDEAPF